MKIPPVTVRAPYGPPDAKFTAGADAIKKGPNAPSFGKGPSAAERKAAQEFEAIFLRKMLACMEKSTKPGGPGPSSGAGDAYSSMIVGALADAVAAAGGIGLGQSLLHSLEGAQANQHAPPSQPPETSATDAPIQGSATPTVQGLRKGEE
jgi:flagellar protein FlgJ